MQTSVIRFGSGFAEFVVIDRDEPASGDVVVNMQLTTISTGTERDALNQIKAPGCFSYTGYSGAGYVEWVGSDVTSVKAGDRVLASSGIHAKHLVRPEKLVTKLLDNISFAEAAVCHIANFPLAGIRKAQVQIGESAMVVGLGILGLFAVQYLKMSGAIPLIAVDYNEERRKQAISFGADYALNPADPDFLAQVQRITDGNRINIGIEVTGNGKALDQTLDCMARFGRVILLGCTRNPDTIIDFYKKVHWPGIQLIGAHAGARPLLESSGHNFTEKDDIKTVLRLASAGRLKIKELISETHRPENAPAVYARLAEDRVFPLGVQFDWSHTEL